MNPKATIVTDKKGSEFLIVFGKDTVTKVKDLATRINTAGITHALESMQSLDIAAYTIVNGITEKHGYQLSVSANSELAILLDSPNAIHFGAIDADDITIHREPSTESIEQLADKLTHGLTTRLQAVTARGLMMRHELAPFTSDKRIIAKMPGHNSTSVILDPLFIDDLYDIVKVMKQKRIVSLDILPKDYGIKVVERINDDWREADNSKTVTIRDSHLVINSTQVAEIFYGVDDDCPSFQCVEVDRTIADQIRQAFPR